MIIYYNEKNEKIIDSRKTVKIIDTYSLAKAVQITEDGKYETQIYMNEDDGRTYKNEAIIDATEEQKEEYRKYIRQFKEGDKIIIKRGRKMKGEEKTIKKMFKYRPNGTYGILDIEYLVFTDNTKVNAEHCDFI